MDRKVGEVMTRFGTANIFRGNYQTPGRPMAIWLDSQDDGERLIVLSVNHQDRIQLGERQFWAKTDRENAMFRGPLLETGLFRDTGLRTRVGGFGVELELWELLARDRQRPRDGEVEILRRALMAIRDLSSVGLTKNKSGPMSAARATALRVAIRDLADNALEETE